jgi:putative pyruvate formate lyase activating enzyme
MSQYRPCHRAPDHPSLNRPLTKDEYQQALEAAENLGFAEVFTQELESAEVYYPDFQREEPFQPTGNR